ncbi:MAG: hypothetical protein LUF82_01375 [Clostridia bacterium]|nr:hypothetical protein [Clostridia bacterium]
MKPINSNYSFCPSCGNKIYNYENRCSECGTFKVIFENLAQDPTTTCCKRCGCILQNDFTYCPSCGNVCKKIDDKIDYEATNGFLKMMRASRSALFAIFFAINAIWSSIFGIFYGIIFIICSLSCIGVQIYYNVRKKYQERKFSYFFMAIAILLLIIAVIVLIAMAQLRAEALDSIINLLF